MVDVKNILNFLLILRQRAAIDLVFKKKMPNFAGGIVALRGCNVIILR